MGSSNTAEQVSTSLPRYCLPLPVAQFAALPHTASSPSHSSPLLSRVQYSLLMSLRSNMRLGWPGTCTFTSWEFVAAWVFIVISASCSRLGKVP